MKLIYIKSTMESKNYAALRSLLKQEQGEKIAPHVFKLASLQTLQEYLQQEKIKYEIYQEISEGGFVETKLTPEPKKEFSTWQKSLTRGYQAMAKNKKLKADLAVWDETLWDSYK